MARLPWQMRTRSSAYGQMAARTLIADADCANISDFRMSTSTLRQTGQGFCRARLARAQDLRPFAITT